MTRDEIEVLVHRLDPGARVGFNDDGRPHVTTSPAMTADGLSEILRALPDVQIAMSSGSPAWNVMLAHVRQQRPTGPSYELDDLEEDGTWSGGRPPEGWGTLP